MEKKTWIEPELTVLMRSKPEEAVLINCKGPGHGPDNPNGFQFNCQGDLGACNLCYDRNSS